MNYLSIQDVSFSYGTQPVLEHISMAVNPGDFVCILGESGCGKSTLLRLIAGMIFPDSGSICIDGNPITDPGIDRSIVFQDYSLFPWLTTGENILLALRQKHPSSKKKELVPQVMYYLREVGLSEDIYKKYPNELSGGMRQRCAICRALALDAPIMLMDEPFGALDAVTRTRLQDMLLKWRNQDNHIKKSVVFVTHDVDEAILLGTKIVVLGLTPSRIIHESNMESIKHFERDMLFTDKAIVNLRNELLHLLNKDIEKNAIHHS